MGDGRPTLMCATSVFPTCRCAPLALPGFHTSDLASLNPSLSGSAVPAPAYHDWHSLSHLNLKFESFELEQFLPAWAAFQLNELAQAQNARSCFLRLGKLIPPTILISYPVVIVTILFVRCNVSSRNSFIECSYNKNIYIMFCRMHQRLRFLVKC